MRLAPLFILLLLSLVSCVQPSAVDQGNFKIVYVNTNHPLYRELEAGSTERIPPGTPAWSEKGSCRKNERQAAHGNIPAWPTVWKGSWPLT